MDKPITQTHDMQLAVDFGVRETNRRGLDQLDLDCLLLGILSVTESTTSKWLLKSGIQPEDVRKIISDRVAAKSERDQPTVDPEEATLPTEEIPSIEIKTAEEIFQALKMRVKGQDRAMRKLSAAFAFDLRRQRDALRRSRKGNVLLIGPTGVGKTWAVDTLAAECGLPVGILNCASTTAPGYIGGDIESCLWDLYLKSGKSVEKTQKGIVFLDEVDKLAGSHQGGESDTRLLIPVQRALLRLLEGDLVSVSALGAVRTGQVESVTIDTRNILFIAGGAFNGLRKISARRLSRQRRGHLNGSAAIAPEDLIKFGLLPEFVGRFSFLIEFADLGKDALVDVLKTQGTSPLKDYEKILEGRVTIEDSALEAIADQALGRGTGARALDEIVHAVFSPLMHQSDGESMRVDRAWVKRSLSYRGSTSTGIIQ